MKVEFWVVGKTKEAWVAAALEHYQKKCNHYCTLIMEVIPESRFTGPDAMQREETERIRTKLQRAGKGYTILLDEDGASMTSSQFARTIDRQQSAGFSTIRFVIGGAYGVDHALHKEVNLVMSLSAMTFPHQLVRVLFMEQLYRAFTILRGEGYHH